MSILSPPACSGDRTECMCIGLHVQLKILLSAEFPTECVEPMHILTSILPKALWSQESEVFSLPLPLVGHI